MPHNSRAASQPKFNQFRNRMCLEVLWWTKRWNLYCSAVLDTSCAFYNSSHHRDRYKNHTLPKTLHRWQGNHLEHSHHYLLFPHHLSFQSTLSYRRRSVFRWKFALLRIQNNPRKISISCRGNRSCPYLVNANVFPRKSSTIRKIYRNVYKCFFDLSESTFCVYIFSLCLYIEFLYSVSWLRCLWHGLTCGLGKGE